MEFDKLVDYSVQNERVAILAEETLLDVLYLFNTKSPFVSCIMPNASKDVYVNVVLITILAKAPV